MVGDLVQEVHFMMNLAELIWGRFNSGNAAPAGSYVNFRTMAVFQQAADGNVPAAGTWCRVDSNSGATFTSLATTINTALGTSFTSGNLHSYSAVDNVTSPGQMTNDA